METRDPARPRESEKLIGLESRGGELLGARRTMRRDCSARTACAEPRDRAEVGAAQPIGWLCEFDMRSRLSSAGRTRMAVGPMSAGNRGRSRRFTPSWRCLAAGERERADARLAAGLRTHAAERWRLAAAARCRPEQLDHQRWSRCCRRKRSDAHRHTRRDRMADGDHRPGIQLRVPACASGCSANRPGQAELEFAGWPWVPGAAALGRAHRGRHSGAR